MSSFGKNKLTPIVEEILGHCGRMISGSKGQYRANASYSRTKYEPLLGSLVLQVQDTCPKNVTVFNANLVLGSGLKVWHGDLDLTENEGKILEVAIKLGQDVYVLHESDARFENEYAPKLDNFVLRAKFDSHQDEVFTILNPDAVSEYTRENGKLVYKEDFNDDLPSERAPTEAVESDFERVNLKIEDMEQDDEEYEFYNEVPFRSFLENWSEKNGPIHNYQNYLIKEQGLPAEDYTDFVLTREDHDRLKAQFTVWYELFHGEFESDYRKQKNIAWAWFDIGPSKFDVTPEWASAGRLYKRVRK